MPRYRLEIEYQGTRYSGWQSQKNARTVQGELMEAIGKAAGCTEFEFMGAGRTDAGVHALDQVAHLDLKRDFAPERMRRALNDILPSDIHVLAIAGAPPRFHARHHAVARSYLYQIARRRTAFGKKLVWWVREDLDPERMRQAGGLFVGMKDFRSFGADDPEQKSTHVLIERLQIVEADALILIRIEGSHFLWRMARRIVGVLAEVGKGTLSTEEVARFLQIESAEPARLTAPPSGLFLERVYYPGDTRLIRLDPVMRIA